MVAGSIELEAGGISILRRHRLGLILTIQHPTVHDN
jgi:hypothetical protein